MGSAIAYRGIPLQSPYQPEVAARAVLHGNHRGGLPAAAIGAAITGGAALRARA